MAAENTITDWISSISSLLGVPLIIWGIIKLFIKDKEQDRKMEALENLAASQSKIVEKMSDQIMELSRQTSEYQYQSILMNESNELFKKQLVIQNDHLTHSKVTEERKLQLEKAERLLKIKPHFIFENAMSNPDSFTIDLVNKGESAKEISIKRNVDSFAIFHPLRTTTCDHLEKFKITGYADVSKTYFNSNQVSYEFDLLFSDVDGNNYKQKVSRDNRKFNVSGPEIIETT